MSEFERVPLTEWETVVSALQRFASAGSVEEEADRITVQTGSAHVTVTRDGTVETGMPLHDFSATDVEALYLDVEGGRLQIRDDERGDYEFRRP